LLSNRLDFASLLAYSPRPEDVPATLQDEAKQSRNLVLSLKDGRAIGDPPLTVAARIVTHLKSSPGSAKTLAEFLRPSATLVPVPKSTLLTKGALWVPEQLSQELLKGGFGREVAALLERTEPIPKAATSVSAERPTALRNYETLRVRRSLVSPTELLLVDDVVTAGATLLGSASRLQEEYPDVPIRGFAAARTVSVGERFHAVVEPVIGTIVLRANGRTQRDP
jgi:hypothetical protein